MIGFGGRVVDPQKKLEKGYFITAHRLGASDLYNVEFLPRGLQQWRGVGNAPKPVPHGYKATVQVSDGMAQFRNWDRIPQDIDVDHSLFEREAEHVAIRQDVIERGKRLYDEKLRDELELEHTGRFIAIEPRSERYFLGDTDVEALLAAREAMPEKRFYLARVGYETAHTVGGHAVRSR